MTNIFFIFVRPLTIVDLLLTRNMKKTILVPTDFSDNAWTAIRYAAQMALHYNWTVHVLHTYMPFSSAFAGKEFNDEFFDVQTEKANNAMKALLTKLRNEFPELDIKTSCKTGLLGEVLPELAGEAKNELVVMGTKGATGLKHVILGSNTFEIIRKSPIPVVAVPDTQVDFKWGNIGLLTNFKQSEIDTLQTFIGIGGKPEKLTLLHLIEKGSSIGKDDLEIWKTRIQEHTQIRDINFKTEAMVNRMDVKEEFPDYVFQMTHSAGLDILIVTNERRSFFANLFSRNLVKALAHQLTTPIFFNRQ